MEKTNHVIDSGVTYMSTTYKEGKGGILMGRVPVFHAPKNGIKNMHFR